MEKCTDIEKIENARLKLYNHKKYLTHNLALLIYRHSVTREIIGVRLRHKGKDKIGLKNNDIDFHVRFYDMGEEYVSQCVIPQFLKEFFPILKEEDPLPKVYGDIGFEEDEDPKSYYERHRFKNVFDFSKEKEFFESIQFYHYNFSPDRLYMGWDVSEELIDKISVLYPEEMDYKRQRCTFEEFTFILHINEMIGIDLGRRN